MYQIQYYPYVAGSHPNEVPVNPSYQYSLPTFGSTAYAPLSQNQSVYQSTPFNLPWFSYPQPQFQSYVQVTHYPPSYSQSYPQYYMPTSQIPVQTSNYSQSPSPVDYGSTASSPTAAIPPDHTDTLRGPPRKPKQSGHALWVGNLPLDTKLEELKDFFAMDGLESIFLIQKSNCAFVNYTTERAVVDALAAFNQKLFREVRLVCRLRLYPTRMNHYPMPEVPAPTSPMSVKSSPSTINSSPATPSAIRYFILKCLSFDEIAWSLKTNLWSTQKHNEEVLNNAFKTSTVYLIFSVNRSGHFHGYARMSSGIEPFPETNCSQCHATSIEILPKAPPAHLNDLSTTITQKTDSTPRGKIIHDTFRRTAFWEIAESGEDDTEESHTSWSLPFRVEWIPSGNPLPFSRVRGLRNPWNRNLEIKVARDGQEIEPSVGAMLLAELNANVTFYQ